MPCSGVEQERLIGPEEDLADGGSDDRVRALEHVGQRAPYEVDAVALLGDAYHVGIQSGAGRRKWEETVG